MRIARSILWMLVLCWPMTHLQAASFDCGKATTKFEKAICASAEVSDLDEQLAKAYGQLKGKLTQEDAKVLVQQQRKWVAKRDFECKKRRDLPSCLANTYRLRLQELAVIRQGDLPTLSELKSVCESVGGHKKITVPFDINNDGIKERAEACQGGTMNVPCIKFFDATGSEIQLKTMGFEWITYWTYGSEYFQHEGRVYNLHNTNKGPSHVRYTTPENQSFVVCEFKTSTLEKMIPQNYSKQSIKVCQLAEKGGLDYVKFSKEPALTDEEIRTWGRRHTYALGDHWLDVDNDGVKNRVIGLDYASGAGRGCDYRYYDELEPSDTRLMYPEGNSMLLTMQDVRIKSRHPNCGGMKNQFFSYDNRIFYEQNISSGRKIAYLEGDVIHEVCAAERTVESHLTAIGPTFKPLD